MPFTLSVAEYADMIYVYGFCDNNSVQAVAEYQQRFPNRRIPTWRVLTRVYQTLQDTSTLTGVRIATKRDVKEGFDKEKGIVQMAQSSPRASTRRTVRRLCVPHTRVWRTLHAEGMYPFHVQQVQHLRPGNFAERLEFYKSFNGSRELHRYSLFTDESQFNQLSIIHTTLMCGQMTIPMPLWKATFNNVLVSISGVQFWTISWLVLSSWKVVLRKRRTSNFCSRNCPNFWRICL